MDVAIMVVQVGVEVGWSKDLDGSEPDLLRPFYVFDRNVVLPHYYDVVIGAVGVVVPCLYLAQPAVYAFLAEEADHEPVEAGLDDVVL